MVTIPVYAVAITHAISANIRPKQTNSLPRMVRSRNHFIIIFPRCMRCDSWPASGPGGSISYLFLHDDLLVRQEFSTVEQDRALRGDTPQIFFPDTGERAAGTLGLRPRAPASLRARRLRGPSRGADGPRASRWLPAFAVAVYACSCGHAPHAHAARVRGRLARMEVRISTNRPAVSPSDSGSVPSYGRARSNVSVFEK